MVRPNQGKSIITKDDIENRYRKFIATFNSKMQSRSLDRYIYILKKVPEPLIDALVHCNTEQEAKLASTRLIIYFQEQQVVQGGFDYMRNLFILQVAIKKYLDCEMAYTSRAVFDKMVKPLIGKKAQKDKPIEYVSESIINKLLDAVAYEWVWKSDAPEEIADKDEFKRSKQVLIPRRDDKEKEMLHLLIETLFKSGLRIAEALQIKFKNLMVLTEKDENNNNYTMYRVKLEGIGKGGKYGNRFITKEVYDKLKEYQSNNHKLEEDVIFDVKINLNDEVVKRIGSYSIGANKTAGKSIYILKQKVMRIESLFKQLGKTIGHFDNENTFHPHMIRHSTGMLLYKRGMPLDQIQKVLGHANIQTSQIYAHAVDTNVGKKFNELMR